MSGILECTDESPGMGLLVQDPAFCSGDRCLYVLADDGGGIERGAGTGEPGRGGPPRGDKGGAERRPRRGEINAL